MNIPKRGFAASKYLIITDEAIVRAEEIPEDYIESINEGEIRVVDLESLQVVTPNLDLEDLDELE